MRTRRAATVLMLGAVLAGCAAAPDPEPIAVTERVIVGCPDGLLPVQCPAPAELPFRYRDSDNQALKCPEPDETPYQYETAREAICAAIYFRGGYRECRAAWDAYEAAVMGCAEGRK